MTARTVMPLEFDEVKFPPGAMIKGHVVQAEPMRLLLVFDSIEVNQSTPLSVGLTLRAVMMPHPLLTPSHNPQMRKSLHAPKPAVGARA